MCHPRWEAQAGCRVAADRNSGILHFPACTWKSDDITMTSSGRLSRWNMATCPYLREAWPSTRPLPRPHPPLLPRGRGLGGWDFWTRRRISWLRLKRSTARVLVGSPPSRSCFTTLTEALTQQQQQQQYRQQRDRSSTINTHTQLWFRGGNIYFRHEEE